MAVDNKPLRPIDEVKNISAPLDEALTQPPNAYTKDKNCQIEKNFRTSWVPNGRVEQIPEAGSFIAADL